MKVYPPGGIVNFRRLRRDVCVLMSALALTIFFDRTGEAEKNTKKPKLLRPLIAHVPSGSSFMRARLGLSARPSDAIADLIESELERAKKKDRPDWLWLSAKSAALRSQPRQATQAYGEIAASTHPLRLWAMLLQAEILIELDPKQALSVAYGIPSDWPGETRARIAEYTALGLSQSVDIAENKLRALLGKTAPDLRTNVEFALARVLAVSPNKEKQLEALSTARRIASRKPASELGRKAQIVADDVFIRLPSEERATWRNVSPDDAWAQAESMLSLGRYRDAQQAFEKLAKESGQEGGRACEARLRAGDAYSKQKARDSVVETMTRIAADCKDLDQQTRAHFTAARALGAMARNDEALTHYAWIEEHNPSNRLADDAAFKSALLARDKSDVTAMKAHLQRLIDRYPDGDMRGEARFLLGWQLRLEGNFTSALSIWEALARDGAPERDEDNLGRTAYWIARVQQALNNKDAAANAYERVIDAKPLSYYAQRSLEQLELQDPKRAKKLRATLLADYEKLPKELSFAWRDAFDKPGFERGLALMRVGEPDSALDEFGRLGLLDRGGDDAGVHVAVSLLEASGSNYEAMRLLRRSPMGFRQAPPREGNAIAWQLAYPIAYDEIVRKAGKREKLPLELVRAIMREESLFNPRAVSVADAYGLVQLIEPTACRFGKELKVPCDPESLKQPENNIRIGAHFMAFLKARYKHVGFVPPAYNAGYAAVDKWLGRNGAVAFDEWVEMIPYDETRRYTRRVLQTYGVYHWLSKGDFPAVSSQEHAHPH